MINNYIRLAFRHLQKHKSQTFINVFGLAVGVGAALLIYQMVNYELSFNKNFPNYDKIVRVVTVEKGQDGTENHTPGLPLPAMTEIKEKVTQFATSTRIRETWPTVLVPNPNGGDALQKFNMKDDEIAFFVEPEYFKVFEPTWLTGNQPEAFLQPGQVVLSKTTAEKCFGNWERATGKTILLDKSPMIVAGVIEDPAVNCDFPLQILISYATLLADKDNYEYREDWGNVSSNDQFFALLQAENQVGMADSALKLIKRDKQGRSDKTFFAQPLSDMHYNQEFGTSGGHVIARNRLWVLSSIGLLVLLMACFNFVNLSTAQALRRSKEVGVRKTLGGSRSILFGQFMVETALVVLLSVGLGAILAALTSPLLQHISELPAGLPFFTRPATWIFLISLTLGVTLFSGFYPALILAGFNPVRALKNNISTRSAGGVPVRKGLVVLQFVIAQVLIVGTIITLWQLSYLRSMDLGFSKDLIYNFGIDADSIGQSKMESLKFRLLQIPGVESASLASDQPASGNTWDTNFCLGRGKEDLPFGTSIKFCDEDYQKTYGLKMVAGRWLEPSDTAREYVVNETLLRKCGVNNPEDALQMELRLGGNRYRKIVGVVKDFQSHSAHKEMEPLALSTNKRRYYDAAVKIQPKNISATTASIQKVFDETFPNQVFDAKFYDESIAAFYKAEDRFANTCKGFAFLAILISCLGLFGLAAHAAQQRTKEIGVRKVLGASVAGIMGLLSRDFLQLVFIAILIATPIAWYFMDHWLSDFAFRIDMKWWMFALAGVLAALVAFVTVAFQSVKAAMANPVKSLRSE